MNKSDSIHNQENIDPNIIRNSSSQQKKIPRSSGQKTPWSANTGEISHSTNDDIEISCFQVGPVKTTQLSPNQAIVCQSRLEQYLTSNNVPDILSYLDEFEDLDWVKSNYITHIIEMIVKQEKEYLKQRIVGLTAILTSKNYLLTRQIIKMIFSVSSRIGAQEGYYALYEIDNLLEQMIQKEELQQYHQIQYFPLILYCYAHQLLYWGLVAECWDLLKFKLSKEINESIKDEFEKTAQKICDMLLRQLIELSNSNNHWVSLICIHLISSSISQLIMPSENNKSQWLNFLLTFMRDNAKIQPTIVTINTMIDQYFKNNQKDKAWKTFENLKLTSTKPDNFTYTTLINGLKNSDNMDLRLAFQLFEEYKQYNQPDQIIYNCLLDACINAGDLNRGFQLLNEMKQSQSIQLDEITYNTLIKGCGRKKRLNEAISLFEEMKQIGIKPNRISFNSLLDSCVKCNKMNVAWRYFEEMRKQYGIFPDNFTYSILVNGIKTNHSNRDELLRAITLLEQIQETGQFKPDEILYNSLIDACVKFNEIQKGMQLFKEMKNKSIEPSSVTYGILIKAYGKMNDLNGAFRMFEEMKQKKIPINDVTYGCLVDACVRNDRLDQALQFIEQMKSQNLPINTVLYTTIIKGFCKLNQTEEAMKYFSLMKQNQRTYPNLITYNSLLDGLVKNGLMNQADKLFQELVESTIKPDLITFSTLLKGHCRRGNMKRLNETVQTMLHYQINPDESLLQLILESCLNQQQYHNGVQIYDQFQHQIPQSTQLLLIIIRLHSQDKQLSSAIPLLNRLYQLLDESRIQHQQLETTINSLLIHPLDEQTYPIITKIVTLALKSDINVNNLDNLVSVDNSELMLLLQNTNQLPCTKLSQILNQLPVQDQQLCRAYISKNNKNDLKEPLNEQFGQVFLQCNSNGNNNQNKKTKPQERSSPFNNENKENVYHPKKQYNNYAKNDLNEYLNNKSYTKRR
ncbi:unnamed protein product (macronuclear) [Paramecium tetraurelia]|uniref:Pentacotripeptide-repeat region of PRORP domain-containing protein n=1 Tax=Paramecium tetraurelia TaxID=5888 RepID=A0DCT1_PARTE|nr:uncharacterized protein GSPATT00015707001 [Paramecium tetraurelia]CAK80848.1 unnamed protein product [Paramecium tetraurelia]|eukprot:XP_001448245.1 hypothetical protein (macronuclear) [Paramecium tetraurelia strain d4-2]